MSAITLLRSSFWISFLGLVLGSAGLRAQSPGAVDPAFDPRGGGNAAVQAVAVQPDGKILVVGNFTSWAGTPRTGVARLNADGSLDASFNPTFTFPATGGAFLVTAQSDGKILVGGYFTNVNGQARNALVRLLPTGATDSSFDANFPTESVVSAVALLADGGYYVGGSFAKVGGVDRLCLARLKANGAVDSSFVPATQLFSVYEDLAVLALLVLPDGRVVAAGRFTVPGGNATSRQRQNLVQLLPSGAVDESFYYPENAATYALASLARQPDGKLLAAGNISYSPHNEQGILRLNLDGTRDSSFLPTITTAGAPAYIDGLLLEPGGRVLICGDFDTVDGQSCPRVARLLTDGSLDPRFVSMGDIDGEVTALALAADNAILAVGDFHRVQSVARVTAARLLNPVLPPFILQQPVANTTVSPGGNLMLSVTAAAEIGQTYQWFRDGQALPNATDPALYLVNATSSANYTVEIRNAVGVVTSRAATVTVTPRSPGGLDYSFSPPASATKDLLQGLRGAVIPRPDGKVYVVAGTSMVLLDRSGAIDPSFQLPSTPPTAVQVQSGVLQPDGKLLLIASDVNSSANTVRRYLPDGSPDPSFAMAKLSGAVMSGSISSMILLDDGRVLVSGDFQIGSDTYRVLRITSTGDVDQTFTATRNAIDGAVQRMALLPDKKILIGGYFYNVGGVGRSNGLARLNADGSLDPTFVPAVTYNGFTVARDGSVYVVKTRLRTDGSVDSSFNLTVEQADIRPSGREIDVPATPQLWAEADGKLVVCGVFNKVNGQRVVPPVRVNRDGSLDASFVVPARTMPSGIPGETTAESNDIVSAEYDGRLYLQGDFTTIGGVDRPRLAAIFTDAAVGTSQLINVSTRALAGSGERALIAGFVLEGDGQRSLLMRGIGPTLGSFGVGGALAAPRLEVLNGARSLVVNNGWADDSAVAAAARHVGAFDLAAGSRDAAVLKTLPGAVYSAQVTSAAGEGVALIEVYDNGAVAGSARLVNVSTRGVANTGEQSMIAGFVIDGTASKQVLVRAIGPALAGFGVGGAMVNPRLKVVTSAGAVVATNDDWSRDANAAYAAAAARQAGAFPLSAGSQDAMLLVSLPPGGYSVVIDPATGSGGITLAEVYEISR